MFCFGVEISLNVHAESGNTSTSALFILPRDYGIVGLVRSTDRDQLTALLGKTLLAYIKLESLNSNPEQAGQVRLRPRRSY